TSWRQRHLAGGRRSRAPGDAAPNPLASCASEFDRLAQGLRRKLLLCQLALAFENQLQGIEGGSLWLLRQFPLVKSRQESLPRSRYIRPLWPVQRLPSVSC